MGREKLEEAEGLYYRGRFDARTRLHKWPSFLLSCTTRCAHLSSDSTINERKYPRLLCNGTDDFMCDLRLFSLVIPRHGRPTCLNHVPLAVYQTFLTFPAGCMGWAKIPSSPVQQSCCTVLEVGKYRNAWNTLGCMRDLCHSHLGCFQHLATTVRTVHSLWPPTDLYDTWPLSHGRLGGG